MTTLEAAADALRVGEPVVLPTDTVYGLAVDPARPGATARLFTVKRRPAEVALPVLAADADQAFELASAVSDAAHRLAEAFWPGGLTIVVARHPGVGWDLGGVDDGTIGLRVPDHDVPRNLAAQVGPLAATSANRHGRPTPETLAEVLEELGGVVPVGVDGGRCAGAPSTVVVCTGADVRIVREGRIPAADVHAAR